MPKAVIRREKPASPLQALGITPTGAGAPVTEPDPDAGQDGPQPGEAGPQAPVVPLPVREPEPEPDQVSPRVEPPSTPPETTYVPDSYQAPQTTPNQYAPGPGQNPPQTPPSPPPPPYSAWGYSASAAATVQLNARVDPSIKERVMRYTRATGVSQRDTIERALDAYLRKEGGY